MTWVLRFSEVGIGDVEEVGGKNASLGEMITTLAPLGIRVPDGFAVTASAYRYLLEHHGLVDHIAGLLDGWSADDIADLDRRTHEVRSAILGHRMPDDLALEITLAYQALSNEAGVDDVAVAVRSSATAEDLPTASFAGQQETYLMVQGAAEVLHAVHRAFASLYTSRAVAYRANLGIPDASVALSVGVQRMVRADTGSSGVIFTLDTESGHRDVVLVNAIWGLGENIVQGRVGPDEFVVHKPTLRDGFRPLVSRSIGAKELTMGYDPRSHRLTNTPTPPELAAAPALDDDDVLELARWAAAIEDHYTEARGTPTPMDIEWAKDGQTGELFVVQARPETVHSQRGGPTLRRCHLVGTGPVLVTGLAVGDRVATGPVRVIVDKAELDTVLDGEVLVTEATDPDWEPVLKRVAGIVTERGGRTSHAAIVAREQGIPAVVGAPRATEVVPAETTVTVSCAEGAEGRVYEGAVPFEVEETDLATLPRPRTQIMVNVGDPAAAFSVAQLPVDGVGLARMEFIIASHVRVHPLALLHPEELSAEDRRAVFTLTKGYEPRSEFFVDELARGIGTIAAGFYPRPVILRFSDFKSNEYRSLLGGTAFEPIEENPMIGWRGASRYYHPRYRAAFELELAAIKRVREEFGLTNLKVMVPFCRTPAEGRQVLEVMAEAGLPQGHEGLEVYVMAEIPSNILNADAFAQVFDGFSIGSNDLTQLTLGVDRDSEQVAPLFDERDPAVLTACRMLLETAAQRGRKVGICGQAPSDHPDFATFLVRHGIDSISLTPDAVLTTILAVADIESQLGAGVAAMPAAAGA